MGKKTPPYKNWEVWTEARFWTFIRSALRVAWNKYPPKYEALKQAECGKRTNKATGRLAMHCTCAKCGGAFVKKDVVVHHRIDAGSLKKYEDLPVFVERLFCSADDLDVVCKECHHAIHHPSS